MNLRLGVAIAVLCVSATACDDDNGAAPPPTATITASPTPTPTGTATPTLTPTVPPAPRAVARKITDPADLIGGPLAVGRVGDYLLANGKIRAIIRAPLPVRELSFLLTYAGNIVDADIVRPPGEAGRDNFGAMTPLINVSSTVNVQEVTVTDDGSSGGPAVIGTVGLDDLLDTIDPTNAIRFISEGAVTLPPAARGSDIPVEIRTEYTLGPEDTAIRIETTIDNLGDELLSLYVGDYVNGSGRVDMFVPSFGFGEVIFRPSIPFLAYTGVDSAVGVTYGIVPVPPPGAPIPASGFGQSGFFAYLMGQDILEVLLAGQPGVFEVPAGGSNSFVRYFVVGAGDVGSIATAHQELLGIPAGVVGGRVTVEGEPAAGALVSVVERPGENGAPFNVLNSFRSDADGSFAGTMPPGDYALMARLPGHPYDSGTTIPAEHPVTVAEGFAAAVDIDLPPTGHLAVSVVDQFGDPLPAKVSLVGFDPAPSLPNRTSFVIVSIDGFVFESDIDQKGAELFGLTGVYFADAAGAIGEVPVPPGEYEVVVSRGPEYSAHRQRVTVLAGATTAVDAMLVRVLDTEGFVSADHHVHLINSLDSSVTRDERIITMAAEGVEYFVATDHDFITDLRPDVEPLGLAEFVAAGVGAEITTFNFGHFNAWPLERDPDRLGGGPIDWGRSGVEPGMDYPSLGSYELSPGEIFAAARERFATDVGVLLVNHLNSATLGHFHITGIDSGLDPPASSVDPALIRQDPAIDNLYDDDYTSLELWIEGSRDQTALLWDQNLGDWFNLLNQGRIKAGVADSDTHTTAIVQAGGPRTYLASSTDAPAELNAAELAASVNAGRLIATNGPFVAPTLVGDGGAVAGLNLDQSNLVTATGGAATLRIAVQSPAWAEFDRIEIYANSVPVALPDEGPHGIEVPRYAVQPTLTLVAGVDFEVREETVNAAELEASLWAADVEVSISAERDTWVVVLVAGTDGVSQPMWPMNPQDLERDGNTTLDDLTDGNLGEGGNLALAFTNPLFIDADDNGRFDPSFELP